MIRGGGPYLLMKKFSVPPIYGVRYRGPIVEGRVVLVRYIEGVSCSISSNKWGRCYFPRFLLREGSFTLMYIASFMILVAPCASLSIMVKHFKSTGCPVDWLCWWMGDGVLRCSLGESVTNGPVWFPYVLFWTVCMRGSELVYYSTFLIHVVPVLGAMSRGHMILFHLKCTLCLNYCRSS